MITRRQFLKLSLAAGAGLVIPLRPRVRRALAAYRHREPRGLAALPGGSLDPNAIPKYVTPLVIPPPMPRTQRIPLPGAGYADYYQIAVRQFSQSILPDSMGLPTTVWSYGSANHAGTFNYPAFSIEARYGVPVRVNWINGLVDANGNYLPHLLPVDQTLHWANPPGGTMGRDMRGSDPTPYAGPVPMVTHVHGAHAADDSDGYAEAWFLPNAGNIPAGYADRGSWYDLFRNQFKTKWGKGWPRGTATFQYPNDQRASTLWYHDHTLGMTRLNVYAGPAGFYLLRGGPGDLPKGILPGPAPAIGDPPGRPYREIPIAIQDRSFNADGSLFYPSNRAFFEGLNEPPTQPYLDIPFIPEQGCTGPSDVSPIWNPEFFGNAMVVNGKTWPVLNVEPRRYRFRLLNGCGARFLILKLVTDPLAARPAAPALSWWQIGAEGGFLPAPVQLSQLLMSPAERADVLVDFSGLPVGAELYLINEGPDEPFSGMGGVYADPSTTGQVMKFVVVPLVSRDRSVPPDRLALPPFVPLGPETVTRQVSLGEDESRTVNVVTGENGNVVMACGDPNAAPFGPTAALLGTVNPDGTPNLLMWSDPITENPALGATEVWEIHNFTVDAHPIHLHEVMFEVVDRRPFGGPTRPPESWETGTKDTVIAYPGEITRVKARFDLPGQYVWHCHIVDHEDNEMMRPYRVGP